MFETRKIKKTTTWVLKPRTLLARMSGRIRIIEAPVVPMRLAIAAPSARMAGVDERRASKLPFHGNTSRGGVEREQHENERQIFGRDAVHHAGRRRPEPKRCDKTDNRQRCPKSRRLLIMDMPPFLDDERSERNRQQHARKGQGERPGQILMVMRGVGRRGALGLGGEFVRLIERFFRRGEPRVEF